MNREINGTVKRNPFFASRVRGQSDNRITSKIINYSLTRTGKSDGTLLMSPQITTEVKLVGADGKTIGKGWPPVSGTSSMSLPVSSYLAKPILLKKGYEEAARNLANALGSALAVRTAQ